MQSSERTSIANDYLLKWCGGKFQSNVDLQHDMHDKIPTRCLEGVVHVYISVKILFGRVLTSLADLPICLLWVF